MRDGTVKDIRLHPDILSSLLSADQNLILNGSDDEKKLLMRRLAGFISISDQIRMNFNNMNTTMSNIYCTRWLLK